MSALPQPGGARLSMDLRLELAHFTLEVACESGARCLGIFGPSGSGKTSLLEALAGWRRGARGRAALGAHVLFDTDRGEALPLHVRRVGYVPQDALLFTHWNVERNLRAGMGRSGADAENEALLLRTVELLDLSKLLSRSTAALSGGERQRVALGRAVLSRPALLLLDEPLGGVDLTLRRRILPWLVRLRDAALAPMVFVSHDPTEVQVLCDEVLALERGTVVARGAPGATLRRVLSREERFENVLEGSVGELGLGTARVDVGEVGVHVTRGQLRAGERVAFALGSDDVLLAREAVAGLSARNVLPCRVLALTAGQGGVRVDLHLGPGQAVAPGQDVPAPLSATLTAEAVRELCLEPGRAAFAVFKSSSCRVLSPRDRD